MTDSLTTTVNKAGAPAVAGGGPGGGPPGDDTSVRVAVRIRPQSAKERLEMCQVCTSVLPDEHQVFLGKDKAFTYDYVYDTDTTQDTIYTDTARSLIEGTFEGYNATIFAYGQTGSGKTYTMGTGFDLSISPEEVGIIPRAVEHLFTGIEQRRQAAIDHNQPVPDFKVNAQFMELYNEEIHDLLDTTRDPQEKGKKSHIKIHEDAGGSIYTVGVTTRIVASLQDTMQCLNIGALSRTTASTNMNAQSSRSHAIFTLHIKQQRIVKAEAMSDEDEGGNQSQMTSSVTDEFETLTAKFHFVDLAGSERLKRTGATGDRAKEGISINCGLLALGNVISALGDKTKKGSHVPYRDSKLTRLLQDSLGGNSQTVMIACVSPSDRDFMETLNTMKYANRARNIQNKVTVNQDKTSKQISALRKEIAELQLELLEYKTGKRQVGEDGVETINDMFHENTMLQTDNNSLRQRIKAMQETVEKLTARNTELLAERAVMSIPQVDSEQNNDMVTKLIQGYITEIEQLRSKLVESESMMESIKRTSLRTPSRAGASPMIGVAVPITSTSMDYTLDSRNDLIEQAKRDLRHMKKKSKRLKKVTHESDKENEVGEEEEEEGVGRTSRSGHDLEVNDQDEDDDEGQEEEEVEDEEEEEEENEDELELSSEGSETEDSDSDDSYQYSTETLHEDLADLTCEISIKEKLVEELEISQKRLHAMRVQYEEKLLTLQARIKDTENERDKVLANVGMVESSGQEKARKVREEYQKKLNDMQSELRKLQAAKKEHAKVLRNQAHYERQLRTLQKDLGDLKQTKVKLMKQIKDESQRNRRTDLQRQKEIAQLRKEQRSKDSRISRLESEKQQKEIVLRRKQEEVESLRKRQKPLSSKAAGRVGKYEQRPLTATQVPRVSTRRKKEFSPKAAKQKWDHLEKMVSTVVLKKQTLSHMERDMERWLKQRDTLSGKLEKFLRKKERALSESEGEETVGELAEQIDTLRANITYVQDNIADCQSSIVQMEEAKDDEAEPASHFSVCTLEESKYLLEHFLNLVITKGLLASQKESENKALQAKLHQERMEHEFQTELLQYLIQQYPDQIGIVVDDSIFKDRQGDSDTGSGSSSGATSPLDSLLDDQLKPINPLTAAMLLPPAMLSGTTTTAGSGDSLSGRSKDKARRKTATAQDLLGVNSGVGEGSVGLQSVPETSERVAVKVPVPVRPQAPAVRPQAPAVRPQVSAVRSQAPAVPETDRPGLETETDGRVGTDVEGQVKMAPPPTSLVLRAFQSVKTPSPVSSPSPSTVTSKVPLPSPATVSKLSSGTASKSQPTSPSVAKVMPSVVSSVAKVPSATASTSRQNGAMSRSLTGALPEPSPSPSLMRRSFPAPGTKSLLPEPSPTMRRKANSSSTSLSRQSSVCSDLSEAVCTPPSSPLTSRKGRDGNVFSRLTSNTQSIPNPNRGTITPVTTKAAPTTPLIHSHTAEGHTKAVLSIFATEELLFSSSKDRTAKVWDLTAGREIQTLDGHPNNVVAVRYSPETRLAYTVSTYFIKVWDLRATQTCVRTLTSSGITNEGPLQINTTSRQLTCPAGETTINDIALNSTGTVLYSAAGNNVRIWELRNFKAVGKLSGGHQAAVMVLAVDDTDTADGNICVVTGSKDHYIKVFEMDEDSVGVMTPKYNLEPPHYDGIQSLCLGGDLLFSGSRDMCIKKWDLAEQSLQHSLNNSHKDWVCGLAFMPGGNCLLSGCRGGSLKVWHIDSCQQLADIQAHKSPINAITTNSNLIFTASNEAGIKMWEPVWECMPADVFI